MTSLPAAAPVEGPRRWRTALVSFLVFLGVVLVPLSLVARYVDRELGDTEQYVATVGPVATNPIVQKAITRRVTAELLDLLRLDELTEQGLDALEDRSVPDRALEALRSLSVPVEEAITSYVERTVAQVVRSEQFADVWVAANRSAHEQMVALLTGEGSEQLDVARGTVSVNLAAVIATVKEVLLDQGFERAARIPEVSAQFVVFQSADLVKVQRLARALDRTATLLPLLALLALAAAVGLARRRRRVLLVSSLAIATTMVLMGVGLAVARSAYLDAVPVQQQGLAAAAEIFDVVVQLLRTQLRSVLVVSLLVAAVSWWSRPGGWLGLAAAWLREGRSSGRVGAFLAPRATQARVVLAAVVPVWFVLGERPDRSAVIGMVLVVAMAWAALELVVRRAGGSGPAAP